MPPKDRNERKAERLRGAGESHAVASFGFSFGAPLLPKRSARRTPQPRRARSSSHHTPGTGARSGSGSARRHRSASVKANSATRPGVRNASTTPASVNQSAQRIARTPTVSTGKRKRGQTSAHSNPSEQDDQDELERIDEEHMSSAQKSTAKKPKAAVTTSPVDDEVPDELEVADENHILSSSMKAPLPRPHTIDSTPVPQRSEGASAGSAPRRTPLAELSAEKPSTSQKTAKAKASKAISKEAPPVTPVTRVRGRPKATKPAGTANKASKPRKKSTVVAEEDVEDELSPAKVDTAASKGKTEKASRIRRASSLANEIRVAEDGDGEVDELSPEIDKSRQENQENKEVEQDIDELSPDMQRSRPVRPPTVESDREWEDMEEQELEEENEVDELSPDIDKRKKKPTGNEVASEPSDSDSDDADEGDGSDEEVSQASVRLPAKAKTAQKKQKQSKTTGKQKSLAQSSSKITKKRQRKSGPNYPIEVFRLKVPKDTEGPEWLRYVKGVNPAEVLNQFFKEMLDSELDTIRESVSENSQPEQRRRARHQISMLKHFQSNLSDLFLDLSSASNNHSVLSRRVKAARKEKLLMRKEYMENQARQNELLLQLDELREEHHHNVQVGQAQKSLNESMYAVQAAIEAGRKKAIAEGREDEGPEIPLEMLMQDVAEQVGSENGGLLAGVQEFNGVLEKAADFLEGRL